MAETKPMILVVEDDPRLLRVYQAKLSQQGWDVLTAADGEIGSALAREKHPNVVLLDLMLPKKDGFGFLADLQKDPGSANTKVIILSNLGQQADVERGKSLGAVDYMVKSDFSLDAIIAKVKTYLPTS